MCSFGGTNKSLPDFVSANRFMKNRGPDKTSTVKVNGLYLIHNLLSITGEFRPQPIVNGDIVCLFNGQIYNYKELGVAKEDETGCDVDCIIPLYRRYGEEFASKLDGEFAIVLIDFERDKMVLATDPFATKPLWFAREGGNFAFGTYESFLQRLGFQTNSKIVNNGREIITPCKVPANTLISLSLSTLEKVSEKKIFRFNLTQYKETYADWDVAFLAALRKRASGVRESVFMGLSGGYDSGAIACGLELLGIRFWAYSISGDENREVLDRRSKLHIQKGNNLKGFEYIDVTADQFNVESAHLRNECENFPGARDNKGGIGLGCICRKAKGYGRKIYLSGQGADETISAYCKNGSPIYSHARTQASPFYGVFPEDLSEVFPWGSFFEGIQKVYLGKEESVAGSYGIETRYPFLDVSLVQEYLWLRPDLKNSEYKAPIDSFLSRHNYPFSRGEKVGFRPIKKRPVDSNKGSRSNIWSRLRQRLSHKAS